MGAPVGYLDAMSASFERPVLRLLPRFSAFYKGRRLRGEQVVSYLRGLCTPVHIQFDNKYHRVNMGFIGHGLQVTGFPD